ncbi:MAG: flavin reductase family protein [Verrucomicrobia bacterium]|nr:flavin reductase family protein [Verrucomicrobiota bacterium]
MHADRLVIPRRSWRRSAGCQAVDAVVGHKEEMKRRLGPSDILFPVPVALVASGSPEKPNLLAVAWIGMMGSDPPIIAISLKKNRYSLEIIRKAKEFTVNIPTAKHFRETDYCGLVSGRKQDKFKNCGFTTVPSSFVKAPLVEQCPFNLECRVVQEIVLGDWVVIFGEILETHVDADKFCPETGKIDVSKIDPLVYCATIREYWNLGTRLGFGFNAGKELVRKLREE